MKESAQAALSYVRSRDRQLGIKPGVFFKHDIHIHVPAGAIPKDGPSAGITMATALASAFTNTPVRHDRAMPGEVTLGGRVLQIGGLKEKILAAKRVGIFKVILPKKNEKDLADIPKHLLKGMTFIFAETMDEVLSAALRREPADRGAHAKPAVPSRRATMSRRPSPLPQPNATDAPEPDRRVRTDPVPPSGDSDPARRGGVGPRGYRRRRRHLEAPAWSRHPGNHRSARRTHPLRPDVHQLPAARL